MAQYTISLPIPSPVLSPNARVHWAVKAKATKALRELARWLATAEMGAKKEGWKNAIVQVSYFFAKNARRDKDNFQSRLKAAFDGIADSGMITDDSGLTHMPMRFNIDKSNPRVEITITEGAF